MYLFVVLVATVWFPKLYGQEAEATNNQEIQVTFINSTGTNVHLNIEQRDPNTPTPPWKRLHIKEMNLAQGQIISTPLPIALDSNRKAFVYVFGTAKNYGGTNPGFSIDLAQSNTYNIELINDWVYPREDRWPPVDPFPVIVVKSLDLNDLNDAKTRAASTKPIQFQKFVPYEEKEVRKKHRNQSKTRKTLKRKKNLRRKRRRY